MPSWTSGASSVSTGAANRQLSTYSVSLTANAAGAPPGIVTGQAGIGSRPHRKTARSVLRSETRRAPGPERRHVPDWEDVDVRDVHDGIGPGRNYGQTSLAIISVERDSVRGTQPSREEWQVCSSGLKIGQPAQGAQAGEEEILASRVTTKAGRPCSRRRIGCCGMVKASLRCSRPRSGPVASGAMKELTLVHPLRLDELELVLQVRSDEDERQPSLGAVVFEDLAEASGRSWCRAGSCDESARSR